MLNKNKLVPLFKIIRIENAYIRLILETENICKKTELFFLFFHRSGMKHISENITM